MNEQRLQQVKNIKETLKKDDFIIDGIFGSYARDESMVVSDLDLLYHLEAEFYNKYNGFMGFKILDEIKSYIAKKINEKIDLAAKNNLSNTAKKYILNEVIYV